MPGGIDFSAWPMWAVLVLVAINTFGRQVSGAALPILPQALRSLLRPRRQVDEVALLDRIEEKDTWIQVTLERKLDRIAENGDKTNELLATIALRLQAGR